MNTYSRSPLKILDVSPLVRLPNGRFNYHKKPPHGGFRSDMVPAGASGKMGVVIEIDIDVCKTPGGVEIEMGF
jgi:hypothetical protein